MRRGLKGKFLLGFTGIVLLLLAFWATWHTAYLGTPHWNFFRYWYVFALFLMVIILPLWAALDRWIFRPLERLRRADLRVTQGDLQGGVIPADTIPEEEIGGVMRARNEMLESLLRQRRLLEEGKEHAETLNQALLSFTAGEVGAGLELILEHVCRHLRLESGWVLLRGGEGAPHRLGAAHALPASIRGREEAFFAPTCDCVQALAHSRELGVQRCSRFGAMGERREILTVPLAVEDHALGVMNFLVPGGFQLADPSRTFLRSTGNTVALALSRARLVDHLRELNAGLEEIVRRRTLELEVLHDLSQQAGYILSYEMLARVIMEHLHRAVPHDVSATILATGRRCELFVRATRPLPSSVRNEIRERLIRAFARLGGRDSNALREGLAVRMRYSDELDTARAPIGGLGSAFQVPVVVGREVVGLLFVGAEPEGAFTEEQVRLLSSVASQACLSIQRMRTLLTSEHRRLESLVERLPEGVLLIDRDARIVLANPAAQAHLPVLAGRTVNDVLTHLGGRPLEEVLRPRVDGLPYEITARNPSPGTFEVTSRPIEAGPEAGGWVMVVRDVSRERELLATDRVLYNLGQALAQAHRPDDVARLVAERAVPLLGFDQAITYLLDEERGVLRPVHTQALPRSVLARLREIPVGAGVSGRAVAERRPVLMATDSIPEAGVADLVAAAREAGIVTVAATPFLAHGQVFGALAVGSSRSIEASEHLIAFLTSVGTQIGMALSYAKERERMLTQERLAALGRLAAGVAHELKNPLSVVTGRVELLEMGMAAGRVPTPEVLSRHVIGLKEAAERMKRIVQGLSGYSKPPKPEPQHLNMSDLLAATRELVAHEARKNNVAVSLDAPALLPRVWGDRSQLMQVLLNLATNAIEAMAATNGGELTLRGRAEGKGPMELVKVQIADTGPGIPPEALEKIWEAFYTTKPDGTGLGLSIVRSLVAEQPGATIGVESEVGRGATFTLTMPVSGPEPPES